jgi:hypothetical protein
MPRKHWRYRITRTPPTEESSNAGRSKAVPSSSPVLSVSAKLSYLGSTAREKPFTYAELELVVVQQSRSVRGLECVAQFGLAHSPINSCVVSTVASFPEGGSASHGERFILPHLMGE